MSTKPDEVDLEFHMKHRLMQALPFPLLFFSCLASSLFFRGSYIVDYAE
jgi:hypothetical protein